MILAPESEAALAEAIRGADGPLEIRGGGTRPLGNPVQAAHVLGTTRLAGITLYEPGALTLVARAGTALDEIEAALAAEGQMLAFEPPDWRTLLGSSGRSTIGGVVATNASGPRRVQAGAARDSLIGLRFVTGEGVAVKNGGRVMKNVTGHDLVKLLAGSHGTLGVLTEVAFKLRPRPEAAASLVLRGLDLPRAVAAMAAALGTPWEVSGAAHDIGSGETALRLEGFAASVAYRAEQLRDRLAGHGRAEIETEPAAVAARWAALRDASALAGGAGDVWRLAGRATAAPALAGAVAARGGEARLLDLGGALLWALAPAGTDLRPGLPAGTVATLVRAAPGTRLALGAFHPEPPGIAALSRALRARFDPRGILNPGRMG